MKLFGMEFSYSHLFIDTAGFFYNAGYNMLGLHPGFSIFRANEKEHGR